MRIVGKTPVHGIGEVGKDDSWEDPVVNRTTTAPPGSPTPGDRYIVAAVATGAWTGKEDNIAEWNGSAWDFTAPTAGMTAYVTAESEYYSWNGSVWVMESFGPHATTHQHGGTDEVATATPGANAIPKADASGKLDSWVNDATTTVKGKVELATDGESIAGVAVQGNDARMSDARTPTAHASTHNAGGGDAMAIDAVAGTGSLRTLGTSATSACAGNDARLSDARTPTAHATSHEPSGGDAMTVDAVAGTGSLRTLGTGSQTACAGNDSRLSDTRTPTAHASSHQHSGSDEVATATPAANAIPKAGGTGKLDVGWMPDAVVGGLNYQGTWNANTNTPTLASGTGTKGHYYVVSVAGTTNLDGITDWKANDWAVFNGTAWEKVDNTDAAHDMGGTQHIADTFANLNTKVSDAVLVKEWAETQVYYVGKHGSDSKDGKSVYTAKLTFGAAMTAASSGDAIVCLDDGVYTEHVTGKAGVRVLAPNATIQGSFAFAAGSQVVFYRMENTINGNMLALSVAGNAHVRLAELYSTSTAPDIAVTAGTLFAKIARMENTVNVNSMAVASPGMLMLDVDVVVKPTTSGGAVVNVTGGTVAGRLGHVTTTAGLSMSGGYANLVIGYLSASSVRFSIGAAAVADIFVGKQDGAGTDSVSGTLNKTVAGIFDRLRTTTGPTDLIVGAVADGQHLKRSGSTLIGVEPLESITIAASDENSPLTTGTGKVTFRMPYAFTLTAVRASVGTAPTGSVLTVDINESGTSILSTKLTIDAGEKTSTTAATPPVISDTALADDAEITVDVDGVGSTIAGAGLKVTLIGKRV